jgi:steroid Delta-isomerase
VTETPLDRYAAFYETLTQQNMFRLAELTTTDVHFRDPFNDVRGQNEMLRIFEKMFADIDAPRFVVSSRFLDVSVGALRWHFHGRLRGVMAAEVSFDGMSAIRFAEDWRVAEHLDYWDPAAHVYERLPAVGWLFRALRRKVAAS